MVVNKTCMIKGCQRLAGNSQFRGLCLQCYGKARQRVESGEVTWEVLESKGLCNSREGADPFSDAYSEAMKEGQ